MILNIAFVPDQNLVYMHVRVLLNLTHPVTNRIERTTIRYVIDLGQRRRGVRIRAVDGWDAVPAALLVVRMQVPAVAASAAAGSAGWRQQPQQQRGDGAWPTAEGAEWCGE